MDKLYIRGLRVLARHGLLAHESFILQPFVADITLELDLSDISTTDSINNTIDYAEACDLARRFLEDSPLDLIESLAEGLALELLAAFSAARSATVRISKPEAPVEGEWRDIAAEVTRTRADPKEDDE